MTNSKFLIVSMAILLVGGMAWAQATSVPDAPYVFVSDSNGDILVIEDGDAEVILPGDDVFFSDIVYGPDEMLYACSPEEGLIIRFDPSDVDPGDTCMEDCESGCEVYPFGSCDDECADSGDGYPACMESCMSGVCTDGCDQDVGPCYDACMASEDEGCPEYFCDNYCYGPELVDEPEVFYEYVDGEAGPVAPECGWFTHKGALVVTDQYYGNEEQTQANGVWIFPLNPDDYPQCEGASPCLLIEPDGFYGGGVTQAANGDLIVVDQEIGRVLGVEYEPNEGFQTDVIATLFDNLGDSLGVARFSTGEIAVTNTGGGLSIYGNMEPGEGPPVEWIGDKPWYWYCDVEFPDPDNECSFQPQFIESAASDWLFVTTADYCDGQVGGSLWAVDKYCMIYGDEPLYPTNPQLPHDGKLYGVALPPTGTAPLDILPGLPTDGSQDYFFNFNDHVLELTTPEECTVELVEARETPKACLDDIIVSHIDFDGDGQQDPLAGVPVLYLGDKAYGQTYYIEGGCGEPNERTFRYAVSAYTEDLFNPRIIRCDVEEPSKALSEADICDPATGDLCEVIDLASFFPGEGVLPDDGRISGSRSSTADFSQYFVVDSGPYGYSGEGEPGCACGFRPPVRNVDEPTNPYRSVFREGRSVPFKVRITDGACDAEDGSCQGDYIAPSGVLLSIAKLYDPDGTRAFEEIVFECRGGGCDAVPYFEDPKKPKTGYHMNVRTDDWLPGTYIATVTVTNNDPTADEYIVPVLVTYFEIIP